VNRKQTICRKVKIIDGWIISDSQSPRWSRLPEDLFKRYSSNTFYTRWIIHSPPQPKRQYWHTSTWFDRRKNHPDRL